MNNLFRTASFSSFAALADAEKNTLANNDVCMFMVA